MGLLIDAVEELFFEGEEGCLLSVLIVTQLGFLEVSTHLGIFHQAHEPAIPRLAQLHLHEGGPGVFGFAFLNKRLGFSDELVAEDALFAH